MKLSGVDKGISIYKRVTSRPWHEVKFLHWPFKVNMYIFRRASTSWARCCQNYVTSFPSSIVICEKKVFAKKRYFNLSWPLQPNPLKLSQFWWHVSKRAMKVLSSVFSRLPTYDRFWDDGTFPKKYGTPRYFNLWWRQYWPERKNDCNTFESTLWELSNAFFRACLSLLVFELGVVILTPGQGEGGWDRHPG